MPYFGCREFPANFALCEEEEVKTVYDNVPEKRFRIDAVRYGLYGYRKY